MMVCGCILGESHGKLDNGVKRHYSTGDMLNERDEMDSRRPKSDGFGQSLYRTHQFNKKRYSFGVSVPSAMLLLVI